MTHPVKSVRILVMMIGLLVLVSIVGGCAQTRELLGTSEPQTERSTTDRDLITGEPVDNQFTLEKEIQMGYRWEQDVISTHTDQGYEINSDQEQLNRVNQVLNRLKPVSHLPDFPWRAHVTTRPDRNALTLSGGVMFFHTEFLAALSDSEIAAAVAHQMAHNAARHFTEGQDYSEAVSLVETPPQGSYHQSSYSTEQEDEALRVSILYLSLAGFNPNNAAQLLQRQWETPDSNSGDYLHGTPPDEQTVGNAEQYAQVAQQYLIGHGEMNPNHQYLLRNNELIDYQPDSRDQRSEFGESGLVAWVQNELTGTNDNQTEAAQFSDRKQTVLNSITADRTEIRQHQGESVVYTRIRNQSDTDVNWVRVGLLVLDPEGIVRWKEVTVDYLPSGGSKTIGEYISELNETRHPEAAGRSESTATVLDVDF